MTIRKEFQLSKTAHLSTISVLSHLIPTSLSSIRLTIEIRKDVLEEENDPMLIHGLKDLNNGGAGRGYQRVCTSGVRRCIFPGAHLFLAVLAYRVFKLKVPFWNIMMGRHSETSICFQCVSRSKNI